MKYRVNAVCVTKFRQWATKVLRQFGYPPDMQKLATETVLKQAELIATEMIKK